MKDDDRMQIASELCARRVAKYPGQVVVCGTYGSTGRAPDTRWSDLKLLFVVHDRSTVENRHFLYRGKAIEYRVVEESKLKELLVKPSIEWPWWIGVLSVLKVLYGDPEQVEGWIKSGQSAPPQAFRETLVARLPWLVESYSRIESCVASRNTRDIGHAVIEVMYTINCALRLLNRRWVPHDYYEGFVDTFAFPKIPNGYQRLIPALWSARDIDQIGALAETLMTNFWTLLDRESIRIPDYQSLDEVPL